MKSNRDVSTHYIEVPMHKMRHIPISNSSHDQCYKTAGRWAYTRHFTVLADTGKSKMYS